MLRVEMSREEVLARVRAELSYAQPDDRRVRLYRLRSMLEAVDCRQVSVDEELFRFLDL
jgi:hypothetical protein